MNRAVDPIAAVRSNFLARCQRDVAVLETALASPDPTSRDAIKLTVHRLSGAAGVFGFAAIGVMAAALDDVMQDGEDPEPAEVKALVDAVKAIL